MTGAYIQLLHASCLLVEGKGLLISGASGSGKSSLCAQLIQQGAKLVADDQVLLFHEMGQLMARAPEALQGKLELYGIGVLDVPYVLRAPVQLELRCVDAIERMPEEGASQYGGVKIPLLEVDPTHYATAAKISLYCRIMMDIAHPSGPDMKSVAA